MGTGLVIAALFNLLLAAVQVHETGSASGVLSAVQSIAASVGVTVLGTVFSTHAKVGRPDVGYREALVVHCDHRRVPAAVTAVPRTGPWSVGRQRSCAVG